MISFYPGPSRVDQHIVKYMREAEQCGILSANHRSKAFEKLYQQTVKNFKKAIGLPAGYTLLFTSSATECWEIVSQSIIGYDKSIHLYNGAFGEKWFHYTNKITKQAANFQFDLNEVPPVAKHIEYPVVCFTHNETSNGTYWPEKQVHNLRKQNPNSILVADATSSLGGMKIDFSFADIWFASVQKCLGLPAGMAVMLVSPKAKHRALLVNHQAHYNNLLSMLAMADKFQTTHTPNVLSIFLLNKILENRNSIKLVHQETSKRFNNWKKCLSDLKTIEFLVKEENVLSPTVLSIKGESKQIQSIKKKALREGFILGEGYGALKESTFRIANFPSLKNTEVLTIQKWFTANYR